MAEIIVTLTFDDGRLRACAQKLYDDVEGDRRAGAEIDPAPPVEQIMTELLEGWGDEVAGYAASVNIPVDDASFKVGDTTETSAGGGRDAVASGSGPVPTHHVVLTDPSFHP